MYGMLAKFGLGFLGKINKKTIGVLVLVGIIAFLGWEWYSMKDEIGDLRGKNARSQQTINQQNQNLKHKDQFIEGLQKEIDKREEISKSRGEKVEEIKEKNREMSNEIKQIDDKCMDTELPDVVKRMFGSNDKDGN